MTVALTVRTRCTLCGAVRNSAALELAPGESRRVRGMSAEPCPTVVRGGAMRCGGLTVMVEIAAPVAAPVVRAERETQAAFAFA